MPAKLVGRPQIQCMFKIGQLFFVWFSPSLYSGIVDRYHMFSACFVLVESHCCQSRSYLFTITISWYSIISGENIALSNMRILAVIFALIAMASGFKIEAKRAQLIKPAKSNQCGPDETSCPAGCCHEANWFCCPDDFYCAATAADCPFVKGFEANRVQLVKLAESNQCGGPDELRCPNALSVICWKHCYLVMFSSVLPCWHNQVLLIAQRAPVRANWTYSFKQWRW